MSNPSSSPARDKRPAQRWQGALEGMHDGLLYGWAIDAEQPDARVVLEVCIDGAPVGSVIADVGRSDLAPQFRRAPDHCHGFVADLGEYRAGQSGSLTVRVANTAFWLPGQVARHVPPRPAPLAASSSVFSDGALRLHGWAVDAADPRRALTVRAFVGQRQVAAAAADLRHPALRALDVGQHGFTLDLPLELGDGRVHAVRVVDDNGASLNGSPITVCCHAAGGKALLAGRQDELLNDVIDNYERHLPRSLGFGHYRQWSAQFEAATPADGRSASALKAGLIVAGAGDRAALARTRDSLERQAGAAVALFGADGEGAPFALLLQRALGAGCDVIGCVRAGDTLPPHALASALEGFALPGAQLVYTDSEHAGEPWFKPAWNPEYALASDYPLELMLTRADVLRAHAAAHGWPDDQAGLSWAMLGALWGAAGPAIVHVPRVLYHFHSALGEAERRAREQAARLALRALEPAATLEAQAGAPDDAAFAPRRLRRALSARDRRRKVSLIIPTRDRVELLERCIDSIDQHTDWPNLQIIVIDNGSTDPKTKAYLRRLAKRGVSVMPLPGPFNFAALNNQAVAEADGEIVGLINNDIEALHQGWLDEIVGQLLRPGVGAVGAKLLWPNGMVQHGGVLLGVGNAAGHFSNRLADADWGGHGRNQLVQQVSAVTAACLFLRKKDYLAAGGMDPLAFPVAFNDVDLCLRLRRCGKAIVWTPHARLLHAESASRGDEDSPQKKARAQRELEQLRQRWGPALLRDPAYHPSLNLDAHSQAFGGLALPPRERGPRGPGLFGTDK